MKWSPLERGKIMIHRNWLPTSTNTRSLEMIERKMKNKHNELLLGNVLAMTIHDSNVFCISTRIHLNSPVL